MFSVLLLSLKMACYTSLLALIFLSCAVKYSSHAIHIFQESSHIMEDGYTVETVFDGNKVDMYPFAILPMGKEIIMLDSVKSTLFRISLPLSNGSLAELFVGSGNGVEGFVDGDLIKAEFKRPKAFTVDVNGNVYVADKENLAIRKISKSGVSTIAGGMANKTGHVDGPSQNARFSHDFDLTFVPSICALLVSDRGNRRIRQIKLPHSECPNHSGLGTQWVIPVAACLASFLLGLVARAGPGFQGQKQMLNYHLMSVVKQKLTSFSVILSVVVRDFPRTMTAMLHLMLMAVFFGRTVRSKPHQCYKMQSKPQQCYTKSESLLDADIASEKLSGEMKVLSNPSEDLISFVPFFEDSMCGISDTSEKKNVVESTILTLYPKGLKISCIKTFQLSNHKLLSQ